MEVLGDGSCPTLTIPTCHIILILLFDSMLLGTCPIGYIKSVHITLMVACAYNATGTHVWHLLLCAHILGIYNVENELGS